MAQLATSTFKQLGQYTRLLNDMSCVERDVKLYSLTNSLSMPTVLVLAGLSCRTLHFLP